MRRPRTGHWDANHGEIAAALIALGAHVYDTTAIGNGFPDMTVGWLGENILIEVVGTRNNPAEVRDHFARAEGWKGGRWLTVCSVLDLLTQLGVSVQ